MWDDSDESIDSLPYLEEKRLFFIKQFYFLLLDYSALQLSKKAAVNKTERTHTIKKQFTEIARMHMFPFRGVGWII